MPTDSHSKRLVCTITSSQQRHTSIKAKYIVSCDLSLCRSLYALVDAMESSSIPSAPNRENQRRTDRGPVVHHTNAASNADADARENKI